MLNDLRSHLGSPLHLVRRLWSAPASGASQQRSAREEKRQRLRLMRRELYQLLEQHPSSRQLMRHLDLVERTLRGGGCTAVRTLPVRVLAKALTELEGLVWDWSPIGLAELRSRLAVMVKDQRPVVAAVDAGVAAAAVPAARARVPTAEPPRAAEVTEVDLSIYEELERSWVGQVPTSTTAA